MVVDCDFVSVQAGEADKVDSRRPRKLVYSNARLS